MLSYLIWELTPYFISNAFNVSAYLSPFFAYLCMSPLNFSPHTLFILYCSVIGISSVRMLCLICTVLLSESLLPACSVYYVLFCYRNIFCPHTLFNMYCSVIGISSVRILCLLCTVLLSESLLSAYSV